MRRQTDIKTFLSATSLAIGSLLVIWPAAATTLPPSRVADLDPRQVRYCRLAGQVAGNYDWKNDDGPATTEKARAQARLHAAALGATNILWTRMTSSYSSAGEGHAEVAGQAYICQRPLPLP